MAASALRGRLAVTKCRSMAIRSQWRRFFDRPIVEWSMFVLGVLLIIVGIIVAPLPGPGGVFFIAPGLALVLKTSLWAKRRYVRFKRWQPKVLGRRVKPGHWADLALRRRSALRRERVRKEQEKLARSHDVPRD